MRSNFITLPLAALSYLRSGGLWNITKIGWGRTNENHKVLDDDVLKVFYPKGSYSPSKFPQGGIGIYASPMNLFPANEVIFEYQVKFDKTFNPVLGGKLPGLFLSEGTDKRYIKNSSGGKHDNNTASIRIAWRKDFDVEAYVYVPEQHSKEYYLTANYVQNRAFGDSLWRGLFKFSNKEWNNVSIQVKLNSFDKYMNAQSDGLLKVTINDVTQTFNKLIWRTNPNVQITSLIFATFFGGSTAKYSTPVDTWTYFKNIQIKSA